ncbi:hypothetical protein SS50377_20947 [Spironucleus salmonicida]|uniref:Uncharacterized protein n=1 Tax=Spironucleus salmonicida TaxID=348837 RepID=V6LGD6_9EUKA|nr:hypothetical protein SS50377_20947 [Spironucleus salmonicida]|eukprot:EST43620.1 Hypothetical protein SS50377_16662 [Spironucleus salmonicida]
MIFSKFACNAFDPIENIGIFSQKKSLSLQNFNNPELSTIVSIPGTIIDSCIFNQIIVTIYQSNGFLFCRKSSLLGSFLQNINLKLKSATSPTVIFFLFQGQLNFIVSSSSGTLLYNQVKNTFNHMSEKNLVFKSVASIENLIFAVQNEKAIKIKLENDKITLQQEINFPSSHVISFNDCLVCFNGKSYTGDLQETDSLLIIQENDSNYQVKYCSYEFILDNTQTAYFKKHSIYGISLPLQSQIQPINPHPYKLNGQELTINDEQFNISKIIQAVDIYDYDQLVDIHQFSFNLVILQFLYRDEYYMIVFDTKQQESIILNISQTQLKLASQTQIFTCLDDIKDNLIIYNQYQVIKNQQPIYQYDADISSCYLNNEDIVVATYLHNVSYIYQNYELIQKIEGDQIISSSIVNNNMYVAVSITKLYVFNNNIQYFDPLEVANNEIILVIKEKIFLCSLHQMREVRSILLQAFYQIDLLLQNKTVDLSFLEFIQNYEITRHIYYLILKSVITDELKQELISQILPFIPVDLLIQYISGIKKITNDIIIKSVYSAFNRSSDFQKVLIFKQMQFILQTKPPSGFDEIPTHQIEPTQMFLPTLISTLLINKEFKLGIFLSLAYGYQLPNILNTFYGQFKLNSKKQKKFLQQVAFKIKVIDISTIDVSNSQQQFLKAFFIAFYELFGLNPISGKIQTQKETKHNQKFVLPKKELFFMLKFTPEALIYFAKFEKLLIRTIYTSIDLPQNQYQYKAKQLEIQQEPIAAVQTQGMKMEVADDDDDDWGVSTKKVKFTIKKKAQTEQTQKLVAPSLIPTIIPQTAVPVQVSSQIILPEPPISIDNTQQDSADQQYSAVALSVPDNNENQDEWGSNNWDNNFNNEQE